ncbi:hypothetical protein [Sinorhizobium sp. GL28]|uniref:hypothetical protein n=1 Tax=Sinorhizobium sp. GL28 TaxID=1358418 RepID=UPI00071D5D3C|nr:hypothetical protein [Sinorhizobium sp. GL28]KSV84132.1 hypothetical protein N184_12630 [Sinorhizobium sp. GL28]
MGHKVLKATNSAARQTFLLQSELLNGPTGNSAPKHLQTLVFIERAIASRHADQAGISRAPEALPTILFGGQMEFEGVGWSKLLLI